MWDIPAFVVLSVLGIGAHAVAAGLTSSLGPVVDLGYIAYVGNSTSPTGQLNSTVTFFGGIRYVQPPIGDLRFRAPKDIDETYNPTRAVVDATSWGPICVQQPAKEGLGVEDCLSLNIWKPTSVRAGAKLPVILYIHGGGFYAGSPPDFPMYDWVAQDQKVVAVSINYRLNLFGFLDGTAVRVNGTPNAGLLDQRAALFWIKRHISAFGGDPDEVTISGESAGGASVLLQATAWGGKAPVPFKRAVAQSIGLYTLPLDHEIEDIFGNVTSAAGCPASGTEAMACLRAAPLSALIKSINNVRNNFLAPTIDGPNGFLPDLPSRLITRGKFRRGIDLVAGHTTNDGRNFAGNPKNVNTDADVRTAVTNRYRHVTGATLDKVLQLYPSPNISGSPFADNYDRAWTIMQDIIMGCMDQHWVNATLRTGRKDAYSYRFNVPNPVDFATNPWRGVGHTSDVYYLFNGATGGTFHPFNATEVPVAREIIQYWTSFTRSGNPTTFKRAYSPVWLTYTENSRVVMSEDVGGNGNNTASLVEAVLAYEQQRCQFWMSQNETRV
ncbi:carboxyesterase [Rhizoctonia solani 123E]|uniref:Carboxylic ester hydrolase n=1 Tax=Rhizoctonia solani 123E TaxID=1423351 RepID=A0A074RTF4_9AGAM|nr:carboxyesterase [Rhizoctonia solani 123E]